MEKLCVSCRYEKDEKHCPMLKKPWVMRLCSTCDEWRPKIEVRKMVRFCPTCMYATDAGCLKKDEKGFTFELDDDGWVCKNWKSAPKPRCDRCVNWKPQNAYHICSAFSGYRQEVCTADDFYCAHFMRMTPAEDGCHNCKHWDRTLRADNGIVSGLCKATQIPHKKWTAVSGDNLMTDPFFRCNEFSKKDA